MWWLGEYHRETLSPQVSMAAMASTMTKHVVLPKFWS